MGKKVLVVDNDRFMLAFIADLLTEQGHQVRTAMDGLAALEILKEYRPDVVFLDLIMPNISGDKLCRMIRKMPELRHTYIVVVSAVIAEEPTGVSGLGANICIAKGPLDEMAAQILEAMKETADAATDALEVRPVSLQGISRRGITQELLSIQRHLGTLLDNLSEGVLELNSEGKVIFANNVALAMWGTSEEKILGKPFLDFFQGPEREGIGSILRDIGTGLPEAIDPIYVEIQGEPVSIKMVPVQDDLSWSILVIVVPIRKIAWSRSLEP